LETFGNFDHLRRNLISNQWIDPEKTLIELTFYNRCRYCVGAVRAVGPFGRDPRDQGHGRDHAQAPEMADMPVFLLSFCIYLLKMQVVSGGGF
jgi:hypothetical protein